MNVLAVAAHPDDIEFMMAGTLLRLRDAGCAIHFWNLADGSCGSEVLSRAEAADVRWEEACASAELAGGVIHRPLFSDIGIFYDSCSLAKVAAGIRRIQPDIILTHSPRDYMEDHQNTSRLVVTAAFTRSMKNLSTDPLENPFSKPVAIYHALPHGLKDDLRQKVVPHFFIDVESVHARKRAMLSCHQSQQDWLGTTQGMNALVEDMEMMSRNVGRMSGTYEFAEGWRRHSHLGLGPEDFDPVQQLLTY